MAKSFVKGAVLLTVCGFIGKVIGAFYRIPFSYIVGAEGVGLYQLVYPLFTLMLTISSSGLPSSISKLLSEQWASGQYSLARKTFKFSMMFLLVFSFIGSLIIATFAYPISQLQGNTNAFGCYLAICPAVFFVGIISGFRGFFQAKENMVPTAVSGLIEQIVKLVVGLGFAYLFRESVVKATMGALLGVTISEVVASVYLIINYYIFKRKQVVVLLTNQSIELSNKEIIKKIISIALPIAFGGLIMPITLLIDSGLIVKLLSKSFSASTATTLYGLQSGVVGSLSNLPVVASVAIATAILPKISKETAYKNSDTIVQSIKHAIEFVLLVALPIAVCFYIFSDQLILFLYQNTFSVVELEVCSKLLKLSSLNIVMLSMAQVTASILQGLGKVKTPVFSLIVGAIIKVISLVILVNVPSINIYGAEISDAICYGVVMAINLGVIHKNVKYNNVTNLAKVCGATVIVGLVAYITNMLVYPQFSTTISLIIAGGTTAIVYLLLVVLTINAEKRKQIKFAYQKVREIRKK